MLDAVADALGSSGWPKLTMAQVAALAGVSRQTLYNSFGSRRELAQAYVMREADAFVAAVELAIRDSADDPRSALSSALEVFLAAAETHPLIHAVTSRGVGEAELLPLVTTRGRPLVDEVTARLAKILIETWPGLKPTDAQILADLLVRLAISYAALPDGPPGSTARRVARVLEPHLDRLLGSLA